MKKILPILLIFLTLTFVGCKNHVSENKTAKTEKVAVYSTKGYQLLQQKCLICHLITPDPAKMNQMIAPPIARVKEHYKPVYPNKEAFVQAVMTYVNDPSETRSLMPGAVKKFHLMPKIKYDQRELRQIAEALYVVELKNVPKMISGKGMTLHNGKKWKLLPESMKQMDRVVAELDKTNTNDLSACHKLGKDIFAVSKALMLNKAYEGDLYHQLQYFFHGIENNMHALMAAQTTGEAQKEVLLLKAKFDKFYDYFE